MQSQSKQLTHTALEFSDCLLDVLQPAKKCTTLQPFVKPPLVCVLRSVYVKEARHLAFSKRVKLMDQLARECTCSSLQSSVEQITKLVNELRWILCAQEAQYYEDLIHEIMMLVEQLLELVKECTTQLSSVTLLVREFMHVYVRKARFWDDPRLMLLMKECPTLQPNSQFELVLENVLNNRKPDNFWPFGFGIPAPDVVSSSTPNYCFIVGSILNRLVLCKYIILHNIGC